MPSYSDKLLAKVFWTDLLDQAHQRYEPNTPKMICQCGRVRKKPNHGYSNLASHVKNDHADDIEFYVGLYQSDNLNCQATIKDFFQHLPKPRIYIPGWIGLSKRIYHFRFWRKRLHISTVNYPPLLGKHL